MKQRSLFRYVRVPTTVLETHWIFSKHLLNVHWINEFLNYSLSKIYLGFRGGWDTYFCSFSFVAFISSNIWQSWDSYSSLLMKAAGTAYPCEYKGLPAPVGGLAASLLRGAWRQSRHLHLDYNHTHPSRHRFCHQAKMMSYIFCALSEFSLSMNTWGQEFSLYIDNGRKHEGTTEEARLAHVFWRCLFKYLLQWGPFVLSVCCCLQVSGWGTSPLHGDNLPLQIPAPVWPEVPLV